MEFLNLTWQSAIVGGLLTLVLLYLTNAIVRFYIFRRKESLDESYPFENTVLLFREQERILEYCKHYFDLVKKERGKKTFVLNVLGLPTFVMTQDIDNITYILKSNFENFGKSGTFKPKMQGLLGNGIFNADGAQWYVHRKTSAHLFKLGQFKTCVLDTFNTHISQLINVLRSKQSRAVDIQDMFHRLTLDSIAYIAFGVHLNTLQQDNVTFAADFDYCTQCLNDSFVNPLWLFERYLTPKGWRYFAALRRIDAFAHDLIRQRRELISKEGAMRSGRVDLLSLYLDKDSFQDMDSESEGKNLYMEPTDANLRDVILNMVIAGRDTTAQALSWAFLHLCTNQDIQSRAREEARTVLLECLGDKRPEVKGMARDEALPLLHRSNQDIEELLTYNAVQRMRYIEACCMETLRLHPSVPKEAKSVYQDDILPDGTPVKRGDILSFNPWAMGRDSDFWGEDCEAFKPERFLDKPKPSPFIFTAFQAGPRTCLGQNFAMLEMKSTIARLLLMFEFTLAQPAESVTYQPSLTLPVKNGLKVFAKPIAFA